MVAVTVLLCRSGDMAAAHRKATRSTSLLFYQKNVTRIIVLCFAEFKIDEVYSTDLLY